MSRKVERLSFTCAGSSRAKQSFKAECDINGIMKKFEKTGVIEHVKQHGGNYGNFLELPMDYHESMNTVIKAQSMFMSLPAKVRKAFDNDPGEFLASVDAANAGDADQLDRLNKHGLLQTTSQTAAQSAAPASSDAPQVPAGEPEKASEKPKAEKSE